MVDADYKVWLIEVNAAPAVTERLRKDFAEELITTVIDPTFPMAAAARQEPAPGSKVEHKEVLQSVSTNETPPIATAAKAEASSRPGAPRLFDLICEI